MKYILALLMLGLFCSCGPTMPQKTIIDKTSIINKPYDDVWAGVIDYFASNNFPIKNMEKASGIITTDFKSFKIDPTLCDCGVKASGFVDVDPELNFNVTVVKLKDNQTKVTVNTFFKCYLWGPGQHTDGYSKGILESEIFSQLSK